MGMGMGMVTFSCVPKFPSVDSMRMQSNKNVVTSHLMAADSVNSLLFLNSNI